MEVTMQYATEHLEELAIAAENGVEVEIARFQKPALQLIVSARTPKRVPAGPRVLGALRGKMIVPSELEWRAMDEELAALMTNGTVLPPE